MIFLMCRCKSEWPIRLPAWRGQGKRSSRDWCQKYVLHLRMILFWGRKGSFGVTWQTWILFGICWSMQRKINWNVPCPTSHLSVGESSLFLCETSTLRAPCVILCAHFCIAWGREQGSLRAGLLHKQVPGVPNSWYNMFTYLADCCAT